MRNYTGELEDDDDTIARDGQRISASMMTLDSVQRAIANSGMPAATAHQPGPIAMSDEERARQRNQLYLDQRKRLSEMWRDPPPVAPVIADAAPTIPASVMPQMKSADADLNAARANYRTRIENQWENPL